MPFVWKNSRDFWVGLKNGLMVLLVNTVLPVYHTLSRYSDCAPNVPQKTQNNGKHSVIPIGLSPISFHYRLFVFMRRYFFRQGTYWLGRCVAYIVYSKVVGDPRRGLWSQRFEAWLTSERIVRGIDAVQRRGWPLSLSRFSLLDSKQLLYYLPEFFGCRE